MRGRPRLGWMDGVKVALGNRGMKVVANIGRSGESVLVYTLLIEAIKTVMQCV